MWRVRFHRCYRRLAFLGLVLVSLFSYRYSIQAIPDQICIVAGREESFDLKLPVFTNQSAGIHSPFTLTAQEEGNFSIDCKLFGIFPIKRVAVEVVREEKVVPCGIPIGIYVQTDGILAIGTGAINGLDGLSHEPAYHLVKSGDYIKTVNGESISNKEELIQKVNQFGSQDVVLGIMRNGEFTHIRISPVQVGPEQYKIGVWVRDDLAGVGTLTYYGPKMEYAALGHPVSDIDTSTTISLGEGLLYETKILGITKGEKGKPGELSGIIDYQPKYRLGTVSGNGSSGIFGTLDKIPDGLEHIAPVEVAMRQEIQKGPAAIISSVSGERKEYAVEITAVDFNSSSENKGIQLKVTDPELLELTGGIVQGMSGSPILQNGKLIGAVTHVFVQDSAKGYGIFIENMLKRS